MTFESALTFFFAIFVFSITPGPGIFAILAKSMSRGAGGCIWLALGMTISDVAYLIMACFGLAAIAEAWEEVFTLIRIAGALYLLYLGWKMWTQVPNVADMSGSRLAEKQSAWAAFVQGFLISASNPKVILFYIAFLPTFLDVTSLSGEDIILASALMIVALMSGLMLVAYSVAWASRFVRSEKGIKSINRVAGSIMAGAGAYIGLRG